MSATASNAIYLFGACVSANRCHIAHTLPRNLDLHSLCPLQVYKPGDKTDVGGRQLASRMLLNVCFWRLLRAPFFSSCFLLEPGTRWYRCSIEQWFSNYGTPTTSGCVNKWYAEDLEKDLKSLDYKQYYQNTSNEWKYIYHKIMFSLAVCVYVHVFLCLCWSATTLYSWNGFQ